jgi:hypothetical protein
LDDFRGMERKSCFRMTRSRQEAEFFAALDGLGAAGGSELVEGAGTVCLDGVFGNEKLRGDLAIAEAAGDQGEDFELACRDAEGLLVGRTGSEGSEGGGKHFSHYHRFADGFAAARDAEAEPDAEGREEDGDERAVELDGVLDDDEAVFGVLESGDEQAADETEDEDVALHDEIVKKCNGDGEEVPLPDDWRCRAFNAGKRTGDGRVIRNVEIETLRAELDEKVNKSR